MAGTFSGIAVLKNGLSELGCSVWFACVFSDACDDVCAAIGNGAISTIIAVMRVTTENASGNNPVFEEDCILRLSAFTPSGDRHQT